MSTARTWREMCVEVSSHKMLTTNWLTQTFYQTGEGAGLLSVGTSLCRLYRIASGTSYIGTHNRVRS